MDDKNLQSFEKNNEVCDTRTAVDIAHIEKNPLVIADVLAPTDLPQTGDTGSDGEPFRLPIRRSAVAHLDG